MFKIFPSVFKGVIFGRYVLQHVENSLNSFPVHSLSSS